MVNGNLWRREPRVFLVDHIVDFLLNFFLTLRLYNLYLHSTPASCETLQELVIIGSAHMNDCNCILFLFCCCCHYDDD